MTGSIETITDRGRFDEIFNASIFVSDVYMRTSSGSLKIRFMGYNSGQIAFKVPYIKSMPDSVLAFARHNNVTIYIELKTIEKQENDIFIFMPVKVQLFHTQRQEGRAQISSDHKNLVYISSITSDFLLFDSIKREKKKVEFIRDRILSDLAKVFTEVKIFFNAEELSDPRMRYFYDYMNNPIYIPQFGAPVAKQDEAKVAYYREQIYMKEQFNMKRRGFVSEISAPILFRGMIPVGYIQINNTIPFNESYVQVLRRAADLASQTISKATIFNDICSDRLLVADMSKSGIGIVFRDRKYIRFFKEKSISCFEIILGDGKTISACAAVKNINLMENKIIKIGCAIREIHKDHLQQYDTYIASMINTQPAPQPPAPQQQSLPDQGLTPSPDDIKVE